MHPVKKASEPRVAKRSGPAVHLVTSPAPAAVAVGYATEQAASCVTPRHRPWLVEMLVQSFVTNKGYCSADARRVQALDELPLALAHVATHIEPRKQAWLAWANVRQTWFVVAQLAAEVKGIYQDAAIRLFFYDVDGQLLASGVWALRGKGNWTLFAADNTR